jgi:hypothetical protein
MPAEGVTKGVAPSTQQSSKLATEGVTKEVASSSQRSPSTRKEKTSNRREITPQPPDKTPVQDIVQQSATKSNRREHKNKYATFSKNVEELDPIEQTIKRNAEEEERERLRTAAPSRGTTVPIAAGSGSVSVRVGTGNVTFENVSSVVPSDPITFGYGESFD